MSQINRPPIGLQSLLGSKNFGENPSNLAQQVLPAVDMFPFWASQVLKFEKVSGNSTGVGSLIETQVPNGKTWGVLSCAFLLEHLGGAAEDQVMSIALDETLTGTDWFTVAQLTNPGNVDDGLFEICIWQPSHIFWLPPLYGIRGILDSAAAAQDRQFELQTVYYELDV